MSGRGLYAGVSKSMGRANTSKGVLCTHKGVLCTSKGVLCTHKGVLCTNTSKGVLCTNTSKGVLCTNTSKGVLCTHKGVLCTNTSKGVTLHSQGCTVHQQGCYCALTRVYCAPARVLLCTQKSVAILVIRGLDLVCCTVLYVYAVLTFSLFYLGDDIIPDACGQSTIMNENPAFASADGSWEVFGGGLFKRNE